MISELATELSAKDVFVFRRVDGNTLFNVGGIGRGAGWAGNVTVEPSFEPWLTSVDEFSVVRRRSGVPFRAFGPYWGTEVVAISTEGDDVVVLGGEGVSTHTDETLRAAAEQISGAMGSVTPEKRDADELEVRQARQALADFNGTDVADAATHLASVTARSLSCEWAAVLLVGPPPKLYVADEGWSPAASEEEIVAALMPLRAVARADIFVEQDLSQSAFPYRPLTFDDGLFARCVVPVGTGADLGILVAAHAGTAPRGFTSLCQRVAKTMAEAGQPLIEGSAQPS